MVDANTTTPASETPSNPEEIQEVIGELEAYRERLVSDLIGLEQRFKIPKKTAMAQVEKHPDLIHVDQALANLKEQLEQLAAS